MAAYNVKAGKFVKRSQLRKFVPGGIGKQRCPVDAIGADGGADSTGTAPGMTGHLTVVIVHHLVLALRLGVFLVPNDVGARAESLGLVPQGDRVVVAAAVPFD